MSGNALCQSLHSHSPAVQTPALVAGSGPPFVVG
jgi:hypothetical protein